MRLRYLALCVGLMSCRDLSLPPAIEGGSVYGVVVVALPSGGYGPAANTQIGLLGSSVSTTADTNGAFFLDGVEVLTGRILFRLGDGASAKQRLLRVEDIHAGPGRQIGLGQVVLSENGTVYGRVLLEDRTTSRSGHSGTRVFVPESPYQGITADDGSFEITGLPEGTISLAAFHAGYQPLPFSEISLRGGERFGTTDLVLRRDSSSTPGALHGTVRLEPPSAVTISVSAIDSAGTIKGAVVQGASYQLSGITPDLYSVVFSAPGYETATIQNVPVSAGADLGLSDVVLGPGGQIDAGFREVDAGCSRCGTSCTTTLDCPANQWCDALLCRPLCGSAADCGGGRACDALTQTCVTPCTGGCNPGQLCDLNRNACTPACDLSLPCPAGLRCGNGLCVPDCFTAADCGAHQSCRAGTCANDGTCSRDGDCPQAEICIASQCVTRPTMQSDAGFFACAAPCDCRSGEVCTSGECVDDLTPTRFAALTGDGGGATPATASNDLHVLTAPGGVVALLGSDVWVLDGGLSLDGGVAFIGGYVACNPARWVRDQTQHTRIVAPNIVFDVRGANARLESLSLESTSSVCPPLVQAKLATDLALHELEVSADPPRNCGQDLVTCEDCVDVRVDGLVITGAQTQLASGVTRGFHGYRSSGSLTGVRTRSLATQNILVGAWFEQPNGPVTMSDNTFDPGRTWNASRALAASNCGASPITLERNTLWWGVAAAGTTRLLELTNCPNVTARDNVLGLGDGAGWGSGNAEAVFGDGSGGTITNNAIFFPNLGSLGTFSGIALNNATPVVVRDNVVDGGQVYNGTGVFVSSCTGGAHVIERNDVRVSASTARALNVNTCSVAGGLRVSDNRFSANGVNACGGTVVGVDLAGNVAGLFERNQVRADYGAGGSYALSLFAVGKQLELYDNYLWAGPPSGPPCGVGHSRGITSGWFFAGDFLTGQVWASGNTIIAEGDPLLGTAAPIECAGQITFFFDGNLLGGGRAPTSYFLKTGTDGANCYTPANWTRNYFWRATDAGVPMGESATPLLGVSGNVDGDLTSCLDPNTPATPWRLRANTPCIDTGSARSQDGGVRTIDLEGRPRVSGAGADIGCSER